MDNIWLKLVTAAVMLFMAWRIFPSAKNWLQNGPKGSSKEWLNASMLLGGVVLFVLLLMSLA